MVTLVALGIFNLSYANYATRVAKIDAAIQGSMKRAKSNEKINIPKYRGDTLSFKRLSKIRDIFNLDHTLPFEKKPTPKARHKAVKKEVPKVKPIVVPEELLNIMNQKYTELQKYPLDAYKFEGVVFQNKQSWGVVESKHEPHPLYLQPGTLIGENYGKISAVSKEGITVDEWKKDTVAREWKKTQAVIH